jgi:hypothetical protein
MPTMPTVAEVDSIALSRLLADEEVARGMGLGIKTPP